MQNEWCQYGYSSSFAKLLIVGAFYALGLRLSAVGRRVGPSSLSPQTLLRNILCTRQDTPKRQQEIYILTFCVCVCVFVCVL